MTTITVLNGNDSGLGSLRDAIVFANSNPNTTINFDLLVTTVTLTSATLSVLNAVNLIIDGIGVGPTITRGSGDFSIFTLTKSSATFDTITITNGTQSGIVSSFSTLILTNVNITDNINALPGPSPNKGGGINGNNSTITVTNSIFSNNSSVSGGGGAIEQFEGTTSIDYCTFNGNSCNNSGGSAIRISQDTNFSLRYSAIYENTTIGGGAIYVSNLANTPTTLVNNTVTNNFGSLCGGIFFGNDVTQQVTITNCTVSHNSYDIPGETGGINYVTNLIPVILNNCIVANNFYTGFGISSTTDVLGSFTGSSYNLIGNGDGSTFVNGVDNNIVGTFAVPIDPLLGPMTNNGGVSNTRALPIGSPAVDAGSNILVPVGILYDQRGSPYVRFSDSILPVRVDMGAFELQQAIVCYSGESLVLVKNIHTSEISETMVKDVYSDTHYVFSTEKNDYIPIYSNIVTGPNRRFVLLKKNSLGDNLPNEDFYVTSGHKILIDGKFIKARNIPQGKRVKIQSQLVYSICTEIQCSVLVNGLCVLTWGKNDWVTYSKKRGIDWVDNVKK